MRFQSVFKTLSKPARRAAIFLILLSISVKTHLKINLKSARSAAKIFDFRGWS